MHLPPGVPLAGVLPVGGEVADRVVAPVIPEPFLHEVRLVHEMVNREELDGGDAEPGEVPRSGSGTPGCRMVNPLTCTS